MPSLFCLCNADIHYCVFSFFYYSIFVFQHWFYEWQALPSYDWVASSLSLMHASKVHLDLLAPNSHGTDRKEQIKIFINYAELMVELSQCYYPSLYLAAQCSPSPWSFIVKEPKKKIVSQKVIIKSNLSLPHIVVRRPQELCWLHQHAVTDLWQQIQFFPLTDVLSTHLMQCWYGLLLPKVPRHNLFTCSTQGEALNPFGCIRQGTD